MLETATVHGRTVNVLTLPVNELHLYHIPVNSIDIANSHKYLLH